MRLISLAALLGLVLAGRWRRWLGNLLGRGLSKQQRLVGIDRPGPRTIQPPQQGIEPSLQRFLVAAFAAQGADQFRDHLLEDGRVVGQGRGIKGRRRLRRGHVSAHAYKTHERSFLLHKKREFLEKVPHGLITVWPPPVGDSASAV